jgi:hypothetical protein
MDDMSILQTSLSLNKQLQDRFANLGSFVERVMGLRDAKVANEQRISDLRGHIYDLERMSPVPQRPRRARRPRKQNQWLELAKIVGAQKGRVSVVGRSTETIKVELTGNVGAKKASTLMKKMSISHNLGSSHPFGRHLVFTKGRQTPESVGRLLAKHKKGKRAVVFHAGLVHQISFKY